MVSPSKPTFEWQVQPQAEQVLHKVLSDLLAECAPAERYANDLLQGCGVRMRDIVDHICTDRADLIDLFQEAGWREEENGILYNRSGYFPAILLENANTTVCFRVEAVETLLAAVARTDVTIEGRAFGPARRAVIFSDRDVRFAAYERSGHVGFGIPESSADTARSSQLHLQAFRARRRQFDRAEEGLTYTEALVDAAVADLGAHWACHLWLQAEREYWMLRCSAGRFQKARQDRFGIGWSNIDHHTYDGSRRHFRHTIRILEKLGYELREMLYAGELAGWGSQILEQPALQSTIFADVDLAPHEIDIDFAHEELPELEKHRRAGLVSALHGESILEAGLNHVAALYDQQMLRDQLTKEGYRMMAPFSDSPHLYQELTIGDWAAVDPRKVDRLHAGGHIGEEEAEKIRLNGAIITHLENIERNAGYKGFNKPGIDGVLRKLDPRAYEKAVAPAYD